MARGFTTEDVIDLALSTRRPYERAKAAGVPLPDIPGRYDNVTMGNFDGVVQALEKLAEFGNWDIGITRVNPQAFQLNMRTPRRCQTRRQHSRVALN